MRNPRCTAIGSRATDMIGSNGVLTACGRSRGLRQCGLALFLLASLCCARLALAQPWPDAGQVMRERDAPLPSQLPKPGKVRLTVPEEKAQAAPRGGGGTVLVSGFRFAGNEQIDNDELLRLPLLAQAVGTRLGIAELDDIAGQVTQYYRSKGYLVATAYIPPQEVEDGIVAIAVLEGKIDSTSITGNARYAADRLKRYLDKNLCNSAAADCKDVVLELRRVERALGVVADLPGIAGVNSTLSPGSKSGTTDFVLNADAGPVWVGQLAADNYGNRYVGRWRFIAGLRLDNPVRIGDRLILNATTSGTKKGIVPSGMLDYSLPVGYAGWRVGLNYTHAVYTLGPPFDVLEAHGQAQVPTAYVSYPLILRAKGNLYFRAGYSAKWLEDVILDSTLKRFENVIWLGLGGNAIDRFAGGGLSGYSITLVGGRLSLGSDASSGDVAGTSGNFSKLNYNLSRDQTLVYFGTSRFSLYGAVVAQWAFRNLDPVEKFCLGGPNGVRAYPTGEAVGDIGSIATLELRYSLPLHVPLAGKSDLGLALFRDQGWLTTNYAPIAGYTGPQHRRLGGSGLAVSLARSDVYALSLMWAARDPGGEKATSDTDAHSRLWVQARFAF